MQSAQDSAPLLSYTRLATKFPCFPGVIPLISLSLSQTLPLRRARYVEEALKNQSWKELAKVNAIIPGVTEFPSTYKRVPASQPRVAIVYAIGGLTYGEISTIRFLGKQLSNIHFKITYL